MKMLSLLLLFIAQISFASDRVGNGGDVLICDEPAGYSVYVLEEYEEKYDLHIGDNSLSFEDKIDILLGRIQSQFPARYNFYRQAYSHFRKNVTFERGELPEIDDAAEMYSLNCYMRQAAYFKRDSNNNNVYFIKQGIWDELSNDQKAVLVMHELIYTEAVALGHTTSVYVRQANRLLFSRGNRSAAHFDDLLIQPLRNLPMTANLAREQLQNAYSERIAVYLLERNLSDYYSDKTFRSILVSLLNRFSASASVATLAKEHIRQIDSSRTR